MKQTSQKSVYRWVCRCSDPPVLLGTYDSDGTVCISIRKRHYKMTGEISATCPKCGMVYDFEDENGGNSK
jgi:hypothetical protein